MNVDGNIEFRSCDGSGDKTVKRSAPYIKKTIKTTGYLTPNAKVSFIQLRKVFTKAPIFCHFNPKYYI